MESRFRKGDIVHFEYTGIKPPVKGIGIITGMAMGLHSIMVEKERMDMKLWERDLTPIDESQPNVFDWIREHGFSGE